MAKQPPPETRLSMRLSAEVLADLRRVSDESQLSQVALVGILIKSFVKTWDETGEISFPFRVVPESTWNRYRKSYLLMDEKTEYKTNPKSE